LQKQVGEVEKTQQVGTISPIFTGRSSRGVYYGRVFAHFERASLEF